MILRLEDICSRYSRAGGPVKVALDRVSLEVDRGQIVGVFGPSGSGKSTLLRIAAGLQMPDSGSVSFNGERLADMSARERKRLRRQEIACIWGTEHVPERMPVIEHVQMPLLVDGRNHRVAERRAREALLACEADQYAEMDVDKLSDGERQRVAIARALVTEPRLLLADGPASRLSPVEQEAIMLLLGSLAREAKVAVLIADSNAEALLRADPILYLADGKLVNPEPTSERGRILRFPAGGSRRAAADA